MSHMMMMRPRGTREDAKRPVDREVVRRAWELTRPYRSRLAWFLVITIVSSVLAAAPPQLIRIIIDDGMEAGDRSVVIRVFGFLAAISIGRGLLALVERWLSASIGEEFILDLRVLLFGHVQSMPLAFFTRSQTGALISRLNNDVIGAQRALTGILGGVVNNAIGAAVTIVAMLILDWRVTLMAIALLPLFIFPARFVGFKLTELSRERMGLDAAMNTTMTERFNVSGALLVQLFGRTRDEEDLFRGRAGRVAELGVTTAMYARGLFVALSFVGAIAVSMVYLVGGLQVVGDPTVYEVGTVVALAAYVTQLYRPLAELTNARVDLLTALVSFERVFEVIDLAPAIADKDDAAELVGARGHVELRDVKFRFPAGSGSSLASLEGTTSDSDDAPSGWILRGVDIDAKPGQMIALVGPSGAGKTTTSLLLPRIHDVTEGAVLIDGHDVRDLTLTSLRSAIGVVTQDPHLFHESVIDNLRYARPDATMDEVVAAAEAARIHHVIDGFPDGYDTIVGERGYRMSGGEKQRLAIARVLLKNPQIVILDEATAHLDSESERQVQEALAELLKGRTSFVIAHRLSTIVDADQILVLRDGEIVERGTHQELVAQAGLYRDLATTQLAIT